MPSQAHTSIIYTFLGLVAMLTPISSTKTQFLAKKLQNPVVTTIDSYLALCYSASGTTTFVFMAI